MFARARDKVPALRVKLPPAAAPAAASRTDHPQPVMSEPDLDDDQDLPSLARALMRRASTAALASLHSGTGVPYASLAAVATTQVCEPLILISDLALHTRNLKADPRASLLFAAAPGAGDPLDRPRLTVMGRIERAGEPESMGRYLARHPRAEGYAGFTDFALYRLRAEDAHYVGGFGRIHDLARDELLIGGALARAIGEAEPSVIEHVNADHADTLALYARAFLGRETAGPGDWRIVGCDAEGFDLTDGEALARIDFPAPVGNAGALRRAFAALAEAARNRERNGA